MPTSSSLRARAVAITIAAAAGAACSIRADNGFPSAAELEPGEFFDEVLVGKPAGVYENGGFLYAVGRVPQEDSPFRAKAAASASAVRELRKWAVSKSDEASPLFPKEPGLAAVFRLFRTYFSGSDAPWMWRNSGTSKSFQDDGDEEYVYALCVRREDVLASLPVPGTGNGLPSNWSDYLRSLVSRHFAKDPDADFLLAVGAPDAPSARAPVAVFSETNGVAACAVFLAGKSASNPFGKPFAAERSFAEVRRRLAAALPESWIGASVHAREEDYLRKLQEAEEAAASNAVAQATAADSATNLVEGAANPAADPATNAVAQVAASVPEPPAPPTLSACERTFLSAGRWHAAPTADPSFAKLAFRAFAGKAPLETKRDRLWELLSAAPGEAVAWNLLGRILREEGDLPGSVACFRSAIRLDPTHEFAWANLAVAYRDMGFGDLAVATAVVARGLASDPWCVKETEAVLTAPAPDKKESSP